MRRLLAISALVIATACGGDGGTTTGPTSVAETLELRLQTDRFRVFAGTAPESAVRAAIDRLEAEYPRITTALGVSSLPKIAVRIWHDQRTCFDELTAVALCDNGHVGTPRLLAPHPGQRRSAVGARRLAGCVRILMAGLRATAVSFLMGYARPGR